MPDTRGQDVGRPMNVGEQEAAIDQVCFPIRVSRRQNVDLSKSEFRIMTSRDGEKVFGTVIARSPPGIRHVTHKCRSGTNSAAQVQRQFHLCRLCALQKTPGGWSKRDRQVFQSQGGKRIVTK